MTTEATFAGTLPAIQRTQDHRYGYNGQWYPGTTDVIAVLAKGYGLEVYKAKQIAAATASLLKDGVLQKLIETAGEDGAAAAIKQASEKHRDDAGKLGTAVHALVEAALTGQLMEADNTTAADYAARFIEWWNASGWKIRKAEGRVIHPEVGYGGTFDILAYDQNGKTVLADLKTGAVTRDAILQLTAYGMAPLCDHEGRAVPMPIPDRYAVIHVTKDGVREVCIDVGQAERMAFLDCVDLHRWLASVKGKTL